MIPLSLFLLGVAAIYVGTIETAFSSIMKLSLRLIARESGIVLTPWRLRLAVLAFLGCAGVGAVALTGQVSFLLLLPV